MFKEVDFILTPTTPTPAFKIGEKKDPIIDVFIGYLYGSREFGGLAGNIRALRQK